MDRISWKAHERIYTEKTNDWYWIVGIVAVSFAAISIIMNNLIFGILILVGTFTLALVSSKKPEVIEIFADKGGIGIGKTFYPYLNLESFWVETRDAHPRIIIKSKKAMMIYIIALLEDMDPK